MMCLQFADICFPSKVILVNERNHCIIFVWRDVRQMSIEPLRLKHFASTKRSDFLSLPGLERGLGRQLSNDFGFDLNILGILWCFRHDLVLVCDDSYLNLIRIWFYLYSLFKVVVDDLHAVETLNSVTVHRVCFVCFYRRNRLNEANHCTVAMSIEFVIITSFERLKFVWAILNGILRDLFFHCIFKISEESETIFKLDLECLIIYWRPCTRHLSCFTFATLWAKSSFSKVLVHDFDLPWIGFTKAPIMIIWNNLEFIW